MMEFPAYASAFEIYPQAGAAYDHLAPLLTQLKQVPYFLRVADSSVNQGQAQSDFDKALQLSLNEMGATSIKLPLPPDIPQEMDFAFRFKERLVAVEIEKANREKILRDILKCHMYLHAGADFAIVGLPRNYPHKLGVWDLFDFGVKRLRECATYGFGSADRLGRILLLGFTQYDAANAPLSMQTRARMRSATNPTEQ